MYVYTYLLYIQIYTSILAIFWGYIFVDIPAPWSIWELQTTSVLNVFRRKLADSSTHTSID